MKQLTKQQKIWLGAGAAVFVVGLLIGFAVTKAVQAVRTATDNGLAIEVSSDRIDVTPEQITAMQAIGHWEFLAISDEEMVDTVRRGIFFDDQLVRIYYGTLRLGIDMQQLTADRFSTVGDTIRIELPPIQLLDDRFIDEARTRSFINKGEWSGADREALYQRARRQMLRQALTPQNIQRAQQNAEQQIGNMVRSMGFKNVVIQMDGYHNY